MSSVYEDIMTVKTPRAQVKRSGLEVDTHPHDHTGGKGFTDWIPEDMRRQQQEYVDNGGVMPVNGFEKKKKPRAEERVADIAPKENFYQTYFDEIERDHQKEKERLEKDEKRLKRQKLMAVIGDGLSAFHEAYSRARGVEPISASANLSGKWRDRYDRLMSERRNADYSYAKSKLDAMAGKRRDELTEQQAKYQQELLELRKKEEERRQITANNNVGKQDWLEKYQQGTLDIKKEQLEIDRLYKSGQISKMERDAASNELRAQASYLRAQNGGGRVGGYTTETVITRDNKGKETGRTTKRTPAVDSGKKGNPMGSQGGGKKRNPMN